VKISILFLIPLLYLYSSDLPDWVFKSSDDNYIYGVGSSKKGSSFSQKMRIATILARANLSENIGVEIESKFEKQLSKDSKFINYSISQTSSHLLRYSFVKDRWISKDGELFILMAIDRDDLKEK